MALFDEGTTIVPAPRRRLSRRTTVGVWALTVALFALLALTVLRMLPVYLAFLGSSVPFREQTALGFAAPRGTSSIVFGLLAFNAMRDDDANIALYVLVVTVLGSVVLHGLFGTRITRALIGKVQA